MRDIRTDLRERLNDLDRQLKAIEAQRVTVVALLRAEEERFGNLENHPRVVAFDIKPVHNLSDLLRTYLADGGQLSTQRLAELAVSSRHPFGDKSPGRSVHFALVGLQRGGHVERCENGSWCLANGEGGAP